MEWHDEGIILHTQSLGERKQVVSLFTPTRGRCAGIFSLTQKNKGWVQCGGKVKARWGARLENHLGYWMLEPLQASSAFLLDAPGPLAALVSAASLCQVALPERHAYPHLYGQFEMFMQSLHSPGWAKAYVMLELTLLEELGYGLDLSACAVTGETQGLVAVSPRTGRAVTKRIAAPYKEKLLPLPSFICDYSRESVPDGSEIFEALNLTGYFLERHLLGRTLPSARSRLLQRFAKLRNCA
jgi:DNA repair protein RecO (recombination protein O)